MKSSYITIASFSIPLWSLFGFGGWEGRFFSGMALGLGRESRLLFISLLNLYTKTYHMEKRNTWSRLCNCQLVIDMVTLSVNSLLQLPLAQQRSRRQNSIGAMKIVIKGLKEYADLSPVSAAWKLTACWLLQHGCHHAVCQISTSFPDQNVIVLTDYFLLL